MSNRFRFGRCLHYLNNERGSLRPDSTRFLTDGGESYMFGGTNAVKSNNPQWSSPLSDNFDYTSCNIVTVTKDTITEAIINNLTSYSIAIIL